MSFYINIEDAAGVKQGDGPIISATRWESTRRLDRAGVFRYAMPAADSRAALATAKRRARCHALVNNIMTEQGAGIVDNRSMTASEGAMLEVSGDDLLRELVYRIVGDLGIDDGAGGATTTGPQLIMALAPSGWSLDTINGYDVTSKAIKHTFSGETVLAALIKLAELTGEHFRLGSGRKLIWMQTDQPAANVRAIGYADPVAVQSNLNVCLIPDGGLVETQDTYSAFVGRVYAYGVGNGDTRIDLNGASVSYTGYAIGNDSKGYYLQHTATWNTYGIEACWSYKDIDTQETLVEAAYEQMRRQLTAQKAYRINVIKLDREITVGSIMRVVYKQVVDGYVSIDIDADLVVLEATTVIDASGVRTASLVVSTVDAWPQSDMGAVVGDLGEAKNYYDHPQPGTSTPADHNHTSGADGGVLTGDQHDGYSEYTEAAAPGAPAANHALVFARDDGAGVTEMAARFSSGDIIPFARQGVTIPTYSETNVVTDRAFDASSTTLGEIANVLGTLIADLRARGIVK